MVQMGKIKVIKMVRLRSNVRSSQPNCAKIVQMLIDDERSMSMVLNTKMVNHH